MGSAVISISNPTGSQSGPAHIHVRSVVDLMLVDLSEVVLKRALSRDVDFLASVVLKLPASCCQ